MSERKGFDKPIMIPMIYVTDDEKITVSEYEWDGKKDHFAAVVEGSIVMPMVHLREYKYTLTDNDRHTKEARVIILCDDRIEPDQAAKVVIDMSPWFYTYGHRVTATKKER